MVGEMAGTLMQNQPFCSASFWFQIGVFHISVHVKKAIKNEATNFLLFTGGCSAVSSSYSSIVVTEFGFHNRGGQVFMILLNLSLFHSLLH